MKKFLLVFLGPTAVGKTRVALEVAQWLGTEIISADSRQFYRELKIGTASPTPDELQTVPHHFVGQLSVSEPYNVSAFENDVLDFLDSYYAVHSSAVMVGGSGLYLDAVCKGIDYLPDPDESLRSALKEEIRTAGLDPLKERLRTLDPEYYAEVDLNNPNRVMRALEVCIMTGQTYSSLRKNKPKKRDFEILKIGLTRPREELVGIIHDRVDQMIAAGLVDEVRGVSGFRHLNALNTVGYKEIFQYLEGTWSLDKAIEKIKTNTRRYAKRQMTWFNRDKEIHWFHPDELDGIKSLIGEALGNPG